ncbi:MAG TPA: aldo/keto reductase [Tepiditoga sp.]|nr:aldo/keto reductase [Tepiditoga sp.]
MLSKFTLGTVQLGKSYGINNKTGKPSKTEAFKILDYAYENGIKSFDTAQVYGESEKIIGEWIKLNNIKDIYITTKIIDFDNFRINFDNSLNNLNLNKINNLLAHDYTYYRKNYDYVEDNIDYLKNNNFIDSFGVSIYEPSELLFLKERKINTVQIPFNFFDNRFIKNNDLIFMKQNNVKIFSRSVFLQGLFFTDPHNLPKNLENASFYLEKLRNTVDNLKIDIKEFLFGYVLSNNIIDSILFGVETLEQLKDNVKILNNLKYRNNFDYCDYTDSIPENIIDPRKW